MSFGGAGGCDFAVPPNRTAREEPVFWAPEVDTGAVILVSTPSFLRTPNDPQLALKRAVIRSSPDGRDLVHGTDPASVNVTLFGGAKPHHPLSAIVPLDADTPDRLVAVRRLWRSLRDRPEPDTRLTPERRRRSRQMLQAVDGRACGASHHEVAEVLFGKPRVAAELWHESSLRYTTIRLVRDGLTMIHGAYRDLLHHRHRS